MIKCPAKFNILIEGNFYIYLALGLLVIPLPWLTSWIIAAVFHEVGHITAVLLSDHRIERIVIGCRGAKIITDSLGKSEWYCALAGPVFGLFLLCGMHLFPRISVCALMQSVYNLLPIYPLDGGRALKGILLCVFEDKTANSVFYIIAVAILAIVTVFLYKLSCTGTY